MGRVREGWVGGVWFKAAPVWEGGLLVGWGSVREGIGRGEGGRTAHEGGCAAPGYADEEEAEDVADG